MALAFDGGTPFREIMAEAGKTEVLGNERLTGALLDRLTHRIYILKANGGSYRLSESRQRLTQRTQTRTARNT